MGRAVDTIPLNATRQTHQAAIAVDHMLDLKERGLPDGGQSQLALTVGVLAVAAELAELRRQLRDS